MTVAAVGDRTPTGTLNSAESIFIEGGPDFYFGGEIQHSPDDNGYHWGLVGTAVNPVFLVGCYENLQLADSLTVNQIRCDTTGVQAQIVRRDFLEVTFDLQGLLPISELRQLLRWSSDLAVPGEDVEYAGIGEVNQQDFHMLFFSRVYDPDVDDWVSFTGHRAQFQQSGALQMRYGEPWIVGITARLFADTTKPSDQRFATVVRFDPSVF